MGLVLRMIRERLRPHVAGIAVRIALVAAVAATPYAFSFLGKWLVDDALQVAAPKPGAPSVAGVGVQWKARTPDQKLRLLALFLAASMGLHLLTTGLSFLAEVLNANMSQRMALGLRGAVHEKLNRSSLAFFGREQIGRHMTRVLDDAGALPGVLINLVVSLVTQVAMLGLGLYLLLRLNPQMTLAPLIALPFYAAACLYFVPRLRRNTDALREGAAALQGHVIERLSNVLTIKNYAQEEREILAFDERLDGQLGLARTQHNLNLYFNTSTTVITGVATLAVLAYGFLNLRAGRMQLGGALAFYQVTAQLFVPLGALISLTAVVQTARSHGERVYAILDAPSDIVDAPDAAAPSDFRGEVAFENVSLRYAEGGPLAVRNVSLRIPAGTRVSLVGPTGSGKSTLIALLTRLYDPTEGVVSLDGLDVRRLPVKQLRRAVGNVLRDAQVFTGTVVDNLRFGDREAGRDAIGAAARLVGLEAYILDLPKGYDTLLGVGGLTLPPERMAQLALARALVTQPAILTIDDTFAVVEPEAERELQAALRGALADRTIIHATSRLSSCEDADMVVVMRQGRVEQTGTHDDLLARPGLYRRMYLRQMGQEDTPPPPAASPV